MWWAHEGGCDCFVGRICSEILMPLKGNWPLNSDFQSASQRGTSNRPWKSSSLPSHQDKDCRSWDRRVPLSCMVDPWVYWAKEICRQPRPSWRRLLAIRDDPFMTKVCLQSRDQMFRFYVKRLLEMWLPGCLFPGVAVTWTWRRVCGQGHLVRSSNLNLAPCMRGRPFGQAYIYREI